MKNKPISVLLLLFTILRTPTFAQEIPLWFNDDFQGNVNRWYMVEEYGEKTYHNALYVNPNKDFRLVAEFDSHLLEGAAKWGISWGRKDAYKFYHFEINTEGYFRIGYQKDGAFNVVEPWMKKRKIIHPEFNTLEVRKKGTDLVFMINDKTVYKMPFRSFKNYTGVALKSSSIKVKFKRFSIYQDMGKINYAEGSEEVIVVPENLGDQVNSKYVDKSPTISPDGKTLYFVRENGADGYGGQDIYYTTRSEDGKWSKSQNIGRPLNNNSNNFVNAIMPDNNTLMAINSYNRRHSDQVLAFTYRTKEGWSTPTVKSIHKLQHLGRWVSFHLAADGKSVVFSMKRPDTYGGRDLYVSFLQADGNFSTPKNLGLTLNTPGNEHAPFLAADGKTLYFDTDGHPGYGGRDIFMSKRLDDSWTNWEIPKNLGPAINTKGSDEGLVIPASGEYAYFVSDKETFGGYDIFSLKMPKALRPEPIAMITGYAVDCFNQSGIPTNVYVYKNGALSKEAYARTNPINGQFKLALTGGCKYIIVAEFNDELEITSNDTIHLDLTDLKEYQELELEPICFKPKPKLSEPTKIPIRAQRIPSLESVYFDTDKYNLNTETLTILNAMADTLKAYPTINIEVLGHTDNKGSYSYNWTLAINRSAAVINHLEERGIPRIRFIFKGFGETKPTKTNETQDGRANNRRVEFRVTKNKTS